jgi:hypothetical protein
VFGSGAANDYPGRFACPAFLSKVFAHVPVEIVPRIINRILFAFRGDIGVAEHIAQGQVWVSSHDNGDEVTAPCQPPVTKSEKLTRRVGRLLGLKRLNDAMDYLQIDLFEGPDSVINFALPKKFNEHLSLPWPVRRIWEEL